MIKHARKLWCKGYHNCQDSRYREYLKAVETKEKLIQKAKRDEFKKNVQRLTESSMTIWKLMKWARLESMKLREALQISDLTDVISTVIMQQEKVETLRRKFFLSSSQTDMWDIIEFAYSDQLSFSSEIQKEEVNAVICRLKVKKASESDEISNELLKMLTNTISAHLVTLFNACMKHEIHFIRYKETKTIALRKSEKDDYMKSGAYRPIALLNTIGKVLKAIMVSRLSDLAERHTLLSDAQMRVRKDWSTETALQLITEQVHTIWKQRTHKVITILCLNQEEAFDNVRIERLIHNLKARVISKYLIDWVQSFMTDRKMTIQLSEYELSLFSINTEIPQGFLISSILFLFFNSELISACTQLRKGISSVEFMNDVNILIYGDSTANNCKKLKVMHKECEQWAQTHGAHFTSVKYKLMHLTKISKWFDMNASLSLKDLNIHSSTSVHILGVQVNSKLWWGAHIKKIEAKMMTQTLTLSKLSMSTWGASFQNVRQIYSAVIQSAWTYESVIWYHSKGTCEMKNHIIKRMTVIQNQCLRKISGAYRVTLIEILEAETFIPSADLYLQKLVKIRTLCNAEDRGQAIIKNACALIVRQLQSKRERSRLIIEIPAEEIRIWANQGAMNTDRTQTEADDISRLRTKKKEKTVIMKCLIRLWTHRWKTYQEHSSSEYNWAAEAELTVKRLWGHTDMSKAESSVLMQLRTEWIELTAFLHDRTVSEYENSECSCEWRHQTVKHVIMHCRIYEWERHELFMITCSTDYRALLQHAHLVRIVTWWFIKRDLLPQFSMIEEWISSEHLNSLTNQEKRKAVSMQIMCKL